METKTNVIIEIILGLWCVLAVQCKTEGAG